MRRPAPRLAVTLVFATALIAPGCGGSDDDQSAGDAAQAYASAREQGDAGEICELYSDELKQQLGAGDDCEAFVEEQTSGVAPGHFKVLSVDESGDRAAATLETRGEDGKPVQLTISLERQDGDWRVTSLGPAEGAAAGD